MLACGADYLRSVGSKVPPVSLHSSSCISSLGSNRCRSGIILTYPSMAALLHLGKSPICGCLGLNAFNHPWVCQGSYVFPLLDLVPLVLSKFLAEHVTGQFRLFIHVIPCWMEASWLSSILSILADIPHWCPWYGTTSWMSQLARSSRVCNYCT